MENSFPAQLHDAIAAVCPILGVSIGSVSDKTTWSICFDPGATQSQQAAAQTAMANFVVTPPPETVLSQEIMAQFTPADMVAIMAAINADTTGQTQLLWYAMVAQRDPMVVSNPRFLAGWSALVSVLGQERMTAIATALGLTVA